MILNIIVILLVLGIGYAWMVRGMFNSLIHFLCAVAAGAIAFAFWERLSLMLIEASPEKGFLSFLEGVAWGISLIVPFVISFLLLRLASDKLVSNNIKNNTIVDYAGGAIFGVGTGVLSAGILVIGMGTMRLSTEFLGYQPLWYSTDRAAADGALVRSDSLWIPVDKLTAMTYGYLSNGTMSTGEPLAKWYPELELVGFSTRVSPGNGGGRNAINPDDFKLLSIYTVGNVDGSESVRDLLKGADTKAQTYQDINSENVDNGYIAGYVVEFQAGAKERGKKGGQIIYSNGQYRLLVENEETGKTQTVFPVAMISESSTTGAYGRWKFDSPDIFITSVGGSSRNTVGFEFVIPKGFTPIGFFAKNIRVGAESFPKPVAYANTAARDRLVRTGSILKGEADTRELDNSNSIRLDTETSTGLISSSPRIGEILSLTAAKRDFSVSDQNELIDGEGIYDIKTVGRQNAPSGRKLRVERYEVSRGQALVFVDIGPESEIGLFSEPFSLAPFDAPLLLIDTNGNEYEAVGFEYTDSKQYHARLTRGSTLTGIQDTPSLSRSRSDQELRLIFIVTSGVKISNFSVGDTGVAQFVPPFDPAG